MTILLLYPDRAVGHQCSTSQNVWPQTRKPLGETTVKALTSQVVGPPMVAKVLNFAKLMETMDELRGQEGQEALIMRCA